MMTDSSHDNPTYLACLTPPGASALVTLAIYGTAAWALVRGSFRPLASKHLPEAATPGQFCLGKLGDGVGDEVVVALKRTDPVPLVEIHCHGGREVLRYLQTFFEKQGAIIVPWQELVQRNETDPCRA